MMEQMRMSDLKPQNQLGKIDFSSLKMQPMVRMLQNNIRRDTLKWLPGAGIRLRREEFSAGGKASFHCLILEPEESKGACLFCHGGGMIFPLQVSSLKVAEYLAKAAKISMWVPDYSLPPAAPFPYPVEECLHVWQRMCRPAETNILYGESVGGALVASLAMVLRDQREKQPDRLMLIDPVTDCETEKYPSVALDAQAVWTVRNNRYMWELYLPDECTARLSYAVPIQESVEGFPPTYLETAEIDILRDEGEAFGKKLQAAGISVEMHRIGGAWHGFDTEINHPCVQEILKKRAAYIRNAVR